jgi:hypothetical protein
MRTSDARIKAMKDCKEQAAKEFATEFGVVKQIDEVYSELLDGLGPQIEKVRSELLNRNGTIQPDTNKYVKLANYGLALRNYRLLHCALDDLESGHYEVAMNLLRTVDECKNLMRYFAIDKNKNEAEKWWFNKGEKGKKVNGKKVKGDPILSHGEVRKRLGISGDMNEMYADWYSHAYDFRSLIPMVLDEKTEYHGYPYFIRDECYRCLGLWIDYANKTIDNLQEVFKVEQIGDDMAWVGKVVNVQMRACQCCNKIRSDLAKEARAHDPQLPNDINNPSSEQV